MPRRRCPKFLLTIFLFRLFASPGRRQRATALCHFNLAPDSLLLSDTQRHALRRGWRQRHSGVRLRETEHRERERDETKKEIGGDATRWVDAFPSTSTSSASFNKKKKGSAPPPQQHPLQQQQLHQQQQQQQHRSTKPRSPPHSFPPSTGASSRATSPGSRRSPSS